MRAFVFVFAWHTHGQRTSESSRQALAIDSNSTRRFSYFYSFFTYRSDVSRWCGIHAVCGFSRQKYATAAYSEMLYLYAVPARACVVEEVKEKMPYFHFDAVSLSHSLDSDLPQLIVLFVRACVCVCVNGEAVNANG